MTKTSDRQALLMGNEVVMKATAQVLQLFDIDAKVVSNKGMRPNGDVGKRPFVYVIYGQDREQLYKYLWDSIRFDFKDKGPAIAFGHHVLDPVIDLRDKVFKKEFLSHRYLQIPFDLIELFQALSNLKPVDNLRKCITDYYSLEGLKRIVAHDLSNLLGRNDLEVDVKKQMTIQYLSQLQGRISKKAGNNKTINAIGEFMKRIELSDMSSADIISFYNSIDYIFGM